MSLVRVPFYGSRYYCQEAWLPHCRSSLRPPATGLPDPPEAAGDCPESGSSARAPPPACAGVASAACSGTVAAAADEGPLSVYGLVPDESCVLLTGAS